MEISSFDDLLRATRQQSQPQRMLFVFLRTVLQKDATDAEKAGFQAGQGGALQPISQVDFAAADIPSWHALRIEADSRSTAWDKLLVACMDESSDPLTAERALQQMLGRVESGGDLSGYLCFTREGVPVQFG